MNRKQRRSVFAWLLRREGAEKPAVGRVTRRSLLAGLLATLALVPKAHALSRSADRALLFSNNNSGPSLDLNFVNNTAINPNISFTRASGATYFDASGTLQTAATSVPRIDYGPNPQGVTNWIRNSTMQGAVAGTPGTLPTNWGFGSLSGLTSSIVGTGVDSGFSYVDIQFVGTATSNLIALFLDTTSGVPSAANQAWTQSAYLKLVGGSLSNVTSIIFDVTEYNGSAAFLADNAGSVSLPTATLQRASLSVTTGNATTSFVRPKIQLGITSGAAVNCTLRIAAPQLERAAFPSAWVPTSGAVATAGATSLGLLIEEQRTNSIRNPRAEGAVAGTPGTPPTYWAHQTAAGISPQIIGSGTENGIPYVDVRWSGTPTQSLQVLYFEISNLIPASSGQTWTIDGFLRLVGGSLTNVGTINWNMLFTDGTSQVANASTSSLSAVVPTTAPLSTQRGVGSVFIINGTNASSVASVRPFLAFGLTSGQAIDITLRIGAPQLERGSFATSLILPPVGTPAASTRAQDLPSIPTSGWLNPNAGTLVAVGNIPYAIGQPGNRGFAILQDGTTGNNFVRLHNQTSSNRVYAGFRVGGGSTVIIDGVGTAISGNATVKIAVSWDGTNAYPAAMGVAQATGAIATPVSLTTLYLGQYGANSAQLNGYLQRVIYYPRAITGTALVALTGNTYDDNTLDLNFVAGSGINDPRLQFSRASGAMYFDQNGTMQLAASNQPRIDYDPVTLACRGLLIEEQRTNNQTNSGTLSDYALSAATKTSNAALAPDGSMNACLVTDDTNNSDHYINYTGFTPAASTTYCYSVFVKKGTSPYVAVAFRVASDWAGGIPTVVYNLDTQSVLNTPIAGSNYGIVPVGNGWYRIWLTATSTSSTSAAAMRFNLTDSAGNITYQGAANRSAYFWGAQIEAGSFPTSYIPTSGSTATRAADVCSMPLGAWYSSSASTLAVEALNILGPDNKARTAVGLMDNTSNKTSINIQAANNIAFFDSVSGINTSIGAEPIGSVWKASYSFKSGAQAACLNGGTVFSATAASLTSPTTLGVGEAFNAQQYNGYIRRVRYWPRQHTNTELQQVTT